MPSPYAAAGVGDMGGFPQPKFGDNTLLYFSGLLTGVTTGAVNTNFTSGTVIKRYNNSRLKYVFNVVFSKGNTGTTFWDMSDSGTVIWSPFFSSTAGFGITTVILWWGNASSASPKQVTYSIDWRNDGGGISTMHAATLEIWEVLNSTN